MPHKKHVARPETITVKIRGAGPCGLATALALANAGIKVSVYEKRPQTGEKRFDARTGPLIGRNSLPKPMWVIWSFVHTQKRVLNFFKRPNALQDFIEKIADQPPYFHHTRDNVGTGAHLSKLIDAVICRHSRSSYSPCGDWRFERTSSFYWWLWPK